MCACVYMARWTRQRLHYILYMSCMHTGNGWMDTVNSIFWASAALRASVSPVEWLFNLHCSTKQSLSFYSNHPAILGKTALFLCWVCCTGSVERRMARVHKMHIVHWPENWLQARSGCGWLLLAMLDITHTYTRLASCKPTTPSSDTTHRNTCNVSIVFIEWNRIAWLWHLLVRKQLRRCN